MHQTLCLMLCIYYPSNPQSNHRKTGAYILDKELQKPVGYPPTGQLVLTYRKTDLNLASVTLGNSPGRDRWLLGIPYFLKMYFY